MKTTLLALTVAVALPFASGCASSAVTPDTAAQKHVAQHTPSEEELIESFVAPDPMMAAPGQMEMNWEPTAVPEKKAVRAHRAIKPGVERKRRNLITLPVKYEN